MPRHRHDWVWIERRYDIHGKAIDTYRCSQCGETKEEKA